MTALGEYLYTERLRLSWDQVSAAVETGITRTTLWRLEHGKTDLTQHLFESLHSAGIVIPRELVPSEIRYGVICFLAEVQHLSLIPPCTPKESKQHLNWSLDTECSSSESCYLSGSCKHRRKLIGKVKP